MSKIKLDLNDFKHVSSDDKSTKLKHKQGHYLVLAHKSLSPDAQKQLGALSKIAAEDQTPVQSEESKQQEPKRFYDGDKVQKPAEKDTSPPKPPVNPDPVPSNVNTPSSLSDAMNRLMHPMKDGGIAKENKDSYWLSPIYGADKPKDTPIERVDPAKAKQVVDWYNAGSATPQKKADGGEISTPYDLKLPCLNPHCKSHGKPHPNCRCYSMAEGGEVSNLRYCANGMPHKADCSYFKGGDVQHYANPKDSVQPSGAESDKTNEPVDEKDLENEVQNDEADQQYYSDPNRTYQGAVTTAANELQTSPQPSQSETPAPKSSPQQPRPPNPTQPYSVEPVVDNTPTPMESLESHKQKVMQDNKQDLINENEAWEHDLNNGHITPKTYSSLFHSKDTLGKIGTLFGLLISGAGSGLSGQSNAVMQMMDNEVQRDLQAQIQSKTNAQNFLKMNQQALMNKAGIRQIDTENQVKAYALTQSQMLQTSYSDLARSVATLPEGPAKELAKQKLAMVYNGVKDKINNINDLATGSIEYYNTLFPKSETGQGEQAFQQNIWKKRMLGPQGEDIANKQAARHLPGITGEATNEIDKGDKDKFLAHNVLDNKIDDVISFARKHANLKDQVNPAVIKVGAQKAHELTNFYNKTVDSLGMTQGRMDWLEKQIKTNPQSIVQQLLGNNAVLNEIKNSNATRRDLLLKNLGFPDQAQQQNNQIVTGKDGKQYHRQGNYMVPVK